MWTPHPRLSPSAACSCRGGGECNNSVWTRPRQHMQMSTWSPAQPPWQPDAAPVGGRSADCVGPGSRPRPQITEDLPFLSCLTSCPLLFVTFPARLHRLLCQSWPIFTDEGVERRSSEIKSRNLCFYGIIFFFKERKPLLFFFSDNL